MNLDWINFNDRFGDLTPPLDQSPDNTKDFAYTYDNIGKHQEYCGPEKGPEQVSTRTGVRNNCSWPYKSS